MQLPRGIGFKLMVMSLLIGLVPMAGLGLFAYMMAKKSMTETSIEFFVERVARDSAFGLDLLIENKMGGTRLLAFSDSLRTNVQSLLSAERDTPAHDDAMTRIRADLNRWVDILGTVDLLAVARSDGTILVTNDKAREATTGRFADYAGRIRPDLWDRGHPDPVGQSLADRPWWNPAQTTIPLFIDWDSRPEPLITAAYEYPYHLDGPKHPKNAEAFSYGFACGIPSPEGAVALDAPEQAEAIVVAYHNWSSVQSLLDRINNEFTTEHARYRSGYTFLFKGDLDTIIGHFFRENYDTSLSGDHGLPDLRKRMLESPSRTGTYAYHYRENKVSGYAPVEIPDWQLGFGVNEADFNRPLVDFRRAMLVAGLVVAGGIVLLVAFGSRRVTEPIRRLIRQTNEIARGNLDARVDFHTHDELALLGDSFNKMAEDLKASNKRVIQAEKAAAWQEMARQVAHEIKNPLTPIKLSAQLIQRAHRDGHPDFGTILAQSIESIVSQTESLRRIASNFSAYGSFPHSDLQPHRLLPLVRDCLALYSHRDVSEVEIRLDAKPEDDIEILVDIDELRRVFLNVFNNAFEAMPEGGTLTTTIRRVEPDRDRVEIRIADTGRGFSPEILAHLFEPYFTTRTSGTGLGLAITRKTIESYDGTIAIESEPDRGATVTITLPLHRAPTA